MNPRITDIADRVTTLHQSGSCPSFYAAVSSVASELDISESVVYDCVSYVPGYDETAPYVPTDEDWRTLNSDPRFGNEFGFVSLGTLTFLLAAFLAVAYCLTLT